MKFQHHKLYMAIQTGFGDEGGGWFEPSRLPAVLDEETEVVTVENDQMFNVSVSFYRNFGAENPILWEDFVPWAVDAGLLSIPLHETAAGYVDRMYSVEKAYNTAEWVKHTQERNWAKDRVSTFGVSPDMNEIEGVEPFVVVPHEHGLSIKIVHAADRIASAVVTKRVTSLVQAKEREMRTLLASIAMDKAPAHLLPLISNLEMQLNQYNQRIHSEGVYLSQNFDSVAEMIKSAIVVNEQKMLGHNPNAV